MVYTSLLVWLRHGSDSLLRANSLSFQACINSDLVYLDSLLPTLARPVLLVRKGDKSEDEDSQSKGKRSEERIFAPELYIYCMRDEGYNNRKCANYEQ